MEKWEPKCRFCGDERRQRWGRTRTKVQHYRCSDCLKTYSERSVLGPATKNLNDYIRWLEVQMAGMRPAKVVRAS